MLECDTGLGADLLQSGHLSSVCRLVLHQDGKRVHLGLGQQLSSFELGLCSISSTESQSKQLRYDATLQ